MPLGSQLSSSRNTEATKHWQVMLGYGLVAKLAMACSAGCVFKLGVQNVLWQSPVFHSAESADQGSRFWGICPWIGNFIIFWRKSGDLRNLGIFREISFFGINLRKIVVMGFTM